MIQKKGGCLFLENVFFVRPRFKEILIGYPALLLGYWFSDKKINRNVFWIFNGLGIIALTSVVNSFCHFHTPVLISFYRSVIGLFCGVLISIVFYYSFVMIKKVIHAMSNLYE